MADISLETKVDLLLKDNENVERENALLESYLERVTPHYSTEAPPEQAAPQPKKKGKAAQRALPTEVSMEQKTEIAQQEVEDLKEEIERTKDDSEKLQDRLRVRPPACRRLSERPCCRRGLGLCPGLCPDQCPPPPPTTTRHAGVALNPPTRRLTPRRAAATCRP